MQGEKRPFYGYNCDLGRGGRTCQRSETLNWPEDFFNHAPCSARGSLTDLLAVLQELHAKGVDLYLHQQGLDTSTPSGRAMFQMLGVFAEFERAMIRERVVAGLTRAKAEGTRLGRPATVADDAAKVRAIRAGRAAGKSIRAVAREHGVGIGTVSRLTS